MSNPHAGIADVLLEGADCAPKTCFYRRRVKRLIDVVIAFALILLFSTPMLVILTVNIFAYRRIFYSDFRLTKNDAHFTMRKFASMNNGKVTRFGAFLRFTALDELPQFFHVLSGKMSLVGPRPHTVEQSERLSAIFGYARRTRVRAGMTGLTQLRRQYDSDETRVEMIRSDAEYLNHCSFWLDVGIMVRTLAVFFIGH